MTEKKGKWASRHRKIEKSGYQAAAKMISFPPWWHGGMISANQEAIWGMSDKLFIEFAGVFANSTNGAQIAVALFKDNDSDALAVMSETGDNNAAPYTIALFHQLDAGSATSQTFKIRAGGHTSGTTIFNGHSAPPARLFGGRAGSMMRVSEIEV